MSTDISELNKQHFGADFSQYMLLQNCHNLWRFSETFQTIPLQIDNCHGGGLKGVPK